MSRSRELLTPKDVMPTLFTAAVMGFTYAAARNRRLKQRLGEVEAGAERDALTNLYLRPKLIDDYSRLQQEGLRRRPGEAESDHEHRFLLIDLDKFGDLNNKYGHNAGDKTLTTVAATILSQTRNRDIVCRWGGEEIAVLLFRASEEGALKKAEEIRESIAAIAIPGVDRPITASIGLVDIDLGKPLEEIVGMADAALYTAKLNGRDQVVEFAPGMINPNSTH